MNDPIIGVLFVLFAVIAYLLGYGTGRYCDHRSHKDDHLATLNQMSIPHKRANAAMFVNNVRLTGRDVDPETLRIIRSQIDTQIRGKG